MPASVCTAACSQSWQQARGTVAGSGDPPRREGCALAIGDGFQVQTLSRSSVKFWITLGPYPLRRNEDACLSGLGR